MNTAFGQGPASPTFTPQKLLKNSLGKPQELMSFPCAAPGYQTHNNGGKCQSTTPVTEGD